MAPVADVAAVRLVHDAQAGALAALRVRCGLLLSLAAHRQRNQRCLALAGAPEQRLGRAQGVTRRGH
jgi:hypothetical protein